MAENNPGLMAYEAYAPQPGLWKDPLEAALSGEAVPTAVRQNASSGVEDPAAFIRALVQETNANVTKPSEPNRFFSPIAPLFGWREKMPERALDDARRKYFYDAMLERFGRPEKRDIQSPYGTQTLYGDNPESWRSLSPKLASDMRRYVEDPVYRESTSGAYEPTGLLGAGSPLETAATWMMTTPQAAYALAERGLNAAGSTKTTNEEATEKFYRAGETLFSPLTTLAGQGPDPEYPSYYADRNRYRRDIDGVMATAPNRNTRWVGDDSMWRELQNSGEVSIAGEDGRTLLERYGADRYIGRNGAIIGGALLDALLNPIPPNVSAVSDGLKSGKLSKAIVPLVTEFGPDGLAAGAQIYAEANR